MARDDGHRCAEHAVPLLHIAAADAAGLDAQQRRVVGEVGDRKIPGFELPRRGLDDGEGLGGGHAASDRGEKFPIVCPGPSGAQPKARGSACHPS